MVFVFLSRITSKPKSGSSRSKSDPANVENRVWLYFMSVAVSEVDYSLHRNLEISNIFPMGQAENSVTSNLSNYKLYSDPPPTIILIKIP